VVAAEEQEDDDEKVDNRMDDFGSMTSSFHMYIYFLAFSYIFLFYNTIELIFGRSNSTKGCGKSILWC
jgi:hypothetical protein